MFIDPTPSPYDLKFRVFGHSVRIHWSFYLIELILCSNLRNSPPEYIILWAICSFTCILWHELGHAFAFTFYGCYSTILLYGGGGLTIPTQTPQDYRKRIVTLLAGPFMNFLLAGIVYGTNYLEPWRFYNMLTIYIYWLFLWVNLFLGVINLLPVWPLDGGQISRELWMRIHPYQGLISSLKLSFVVALAVVVYSICFMLNVLPPELSIANFYPGMLTTMLFGMLAFQSFHLLQSTQRVGHYDYHRPWE